MMNFVAKLRQRFYPIEKDVMPPHKVWRVALGFLCILALFSATGGRMYSDGWSLNGIPVSGYFLWAFFNVYLGIGVVWELLAPRDEKTRNMPRKWRWSLAALTVLVVAVSLVVVRTLPGAGPS